MPKHYDIDPSQVQEAQEKPYESETVGAEGGYFSDVERGGMQDPSGAADVIAMTPEQRREKLQDFAYTCFTALGEVLEAFDLPVELTEVERKNLGEVWGDVGVHYMQIKSRKELDLLNATAYTSGITIKKTKQIKDQNKLTDEQD